MSNFATLPTGKDTKRRGHGRHELPVVASSLSVIVCRPLNGLRITRSSCAKSHKKEAANMSSLSACRRCTVGRAHARGAIPTEWAPGDPIELRTITVGGSPA
jgi:hypothetical protein